MSDKYEKLDETFNVEPVEVEVTEKKIEKINIRSFLSSGSGSGPSRMAPWTSDGPLDPLDRYKILQKNVFF